MKLIIRGEARNIIAYALFILAVPVILWGYWAGAQQDGTIMEDYIEYEQASELIKQNKPEQAIPVFKELAVKYPESPAINYRYGLVLGQKQAYQEAGRYLKKAKDTRPAILYDKLFLIQYGEILYRSGYYEESKRYLLAGLQGNADNNATVGRQIIADIDQRLKINAAERTEQGGKKR